MTCFAVDDGGYTEPAAEDVNVPVAELPSLSAMRDAVRSARGDAAWCLAFEGGEPVDRAAA